MKAEEAELVVVDHPLTPIQQRNLEKALQCKVLDRTGLILEIFGARASTAEGTLQVELAHLKWQKSRLVRSWTHLERQRGGLGFIGGPGETQIEADRRLIQERIMRLERDLEQVTRTRDLHRQKRKKVPQPVVALVGYTNAGKSTLFNRLTQSDVFAQGPPVRNAGSDAAARHAAAWQRHHPVRHCRVHLRSPHASDCRVPGDAGGGDGGEPDPACARHLA